MEARFSAPVQTVPGAHPASYTTGTGSFPGVKRPGCGVDHPPSSSAEVDGRVELYICSPSGPSWPVLGRTYIYLYCSENLTELTNVTADAENVALLNECSQYAGGVHFLLSGLLTRKPNNNFSVMKREFVNTS